MLPSRPALPSPPASSHGARAVSARCRRGGPGARGTPRSCTGAAGPPDAAAWGADATDSVAPEHNASVVFRQGMGYSAGTIQMGRGTRPDDPQPTPVRTGSVARPRDGDLMNELTSVESRALASPAYITHSSTSQRDFAPVHINPFLKGALRNFRYRGWPVGSMYSYRLLSESYPRASALRPYLGGSSGHWGF